MFSSTPLINKRLSRVINQSVTYQAEEDDELERSRLRRDSDIQRRMSAVGSPKSPQLLNEKEIREHFQICLKLHAENKISSKNAWKLKMIDCMVQSLSEDSLHVAGTSLDASTKIYGIRVDTLHKDALKLASNLARITDQSETDVTGVDSYGLNDSDWNNEVSKRKNKRQKSTIAKNPESLLGDVPKLPSVLFQRGVNPETSTVENLLTSKIPMNHGCYKYMLFSEEKAWPSYGKKDPNIDFEKAYPFKISKIKNIQICAPFVDFKIDEWDPEEEANLLSAEVNNAVNENEVSYDSDGIPIAVLDGSVHDLFEKAADAQHQHGSSGEEEIDREAQVAVQKNNIANKIVKFRRDDSINEYIYPSSINMKNKVISQAWAGPSHWKLKYVQRSKQVFSGLKKQTAKVVKKTRAEPSLIDFYVDIPGFDKTKTYKIKQCRIDITPAKCTLPLVMPISSGIFRYLMLKRVIINAEDKPYEENVEDTEVQSYNYANPYDFSYCPRQELDGNNYDLANNGEVNEDVQNDDSEAAQYNILDVNLLRVPDLVSKPCTSYGLPAKKIDMKNLKIATWKSLVSNNPEEVISDESMYEREVHKKNFSDVYKEVFKRLPKQMKGDLSCPLAVVALLHVATKHNLNLTGQSDLNDFTIEQATDE